MSAVNHGLGGNAIVAERRRHKAGAIQEIGALVIQTLPCLLCLAGIIACTWVSFRLGLSLGTVGFLYLIFVVLAAFYGGFRQATMVSFFAVGCLDFFFDQPIFSFSVGRLSSWVELSAFEFTALVISQLSNRAQLRAVEAIAERRNTDRLYQAARRMLLLDSRGDVGHLVLSLICETFEIRGVVLFDAHSATTYESGQPTLGADRQTRQAFLADS